MLWNLWIQGKNFSWSATHAGEDVKQKWYLTKKTLKEAHLKQAFDISVAILNQSLFIGCNFLTKWRHVPISNSWLVTNLESQPGTLCDNRIGQTNQTSESDENIYKRKFWKKKKRLQSGCCGDVAPQQERDCRIVQFSTQRDEAAEIFWRRKKSQNCKNVKFWQVMIS